MTTEEYKKILLMAIDNELEAYEFYHSAAAKSVDAGLKEIFAELADEEMKHKKLIESFVSDFSTKMNFHNSTDYKVSESVELPKLTTTMSFADGIALAMKKEEEAMVMYTNFAEASANTDQKNTFLQLAKMEQGHKIRLENLYNNAAYNEIW